MMLSQPPALENGLLDIDNETPAFDYPWQADAFGLTVQLYRNGRFTWAQWVEVFSAEIKASPVQPGETPNDAYYRQWLTALETIVRSSGLVSVAEIAERAEDWRKAYLNTPHGEPVLLMNALCPPPHHHSHAETPRGPVKVVPAFTA